MRIILAVFMICLCLPSFAETVQTPSFAVTNSDNTELISMENGSLLSTLSGGAWVEITGEAPGYYLAISQDGILGYIRRDRLDPAQVRYGGMGEVVNPSAKEYLNLRKSPSLQAEVLQICFTGTPCVILEHQNGWYHVRVNGQEGYFREEYVQERTWPLGEKAVTVHAQGKTGVNLRQGPGYAYPATRTCADGTFLTLLKQGTDWWMVSAQGEVGFVRSSFLYDGILNPVYQEDSLSGAVAIVTNPKATQVLNLRERPSRNSPSLRQYSNGTELTLLQQGTVWCRVTDGEGSTGYCMTEFLTLRNAPDLPTRTVDHPDGTYVNLRNAPSMTGSIILMQVPHGQDVVVLVPDTDGWTMVEYGGQEGFMASMFLK